MLPLIETIIGFSAIMLLLSYLVKSLTSVIKNHADFYSDNLRHEIYSLLKGTFDKEHWAEIAKKLNTPELAKDWKRLGEEYLTKENITWVLKKLHAELNMKVDIEDVIKNLEGRLAVHVGNVKYMFEKRLKNLTLVVGLVLCLGLNINAVTIWDKLYNDQDVRAKFSSTQFVDSLPTPKLDQNIQDVEKEIAEAEKKTKEEENKEDDKDEKIIANLKENEKKLIEEKEKLAKQREAVLKQVRYFQGQVGFGIGKIWTETPKEGEEWGFLFLEFLGSLITGILVSIGAPYWHDLLRSLTRLRKGTTGEPVTKIGNTEEQKIAQQIELEKRRKETADAQRKQLETEIARAYARPQPPQDA